MRAIVSCAAPFADGQQRRTIPKGKTQRKRNSQKARRPEGLLACLHRAGLPAQEIACRDAQFQSTEPLQRSWTRTGESLLVTAAESVGMNMGFGDDAG